MPRWSRWLEPWLPPSQAEEAQPRARFFVITVLFGAAVTTFSAVVAFLSGLSVLGWLNVVAAGVATATLWRFKREAQSAPVVRDFSWFFLVFFTPWPQRPWS
jgi:hypothetical protein